MLAINLQQFQAMWLLCVPHVDANNSILPFSCVQHTSNAKKAFRRVLLLIICCRRWRAHTEAHVGSLGLTVVSFFTTTIDCLTNSYHDMALVEMKSRWQLLLHSLQQRSDGVGKFCHGISVFC